MHETQEHIHLLLHNDQKTRGCNRNLVGTIKKSKMNQPPDEQERDGSNRRQGRNANQAQAMPMLFPSDLLVALRQAAVESALSHIPDRNNYETLEEWHDGILRFVLQVHALPPDHPEPPPRVPYNPAPVQLLAVGARHNDATQFHVIPMETESRGESSASSDRQ